MHQLASRPKGQYEGLGLLESVSCQWVWEGRTWGTAGDQTLPRRGTFWYISGEKAFGVGPRVEQVWAWGETLTAEVWGSPVHTHALVQTGLSIGSHCIAQTLAVSAHVAPTGIAHTGFVVGQVVYLWSGGCHVSIRLLRWWQGGRLDFAALGHRHGGSVLEP